MATDAQPMRVRSYDAAQQANPGKQAKIVALLPLWQRGLVHMQLLQVRRMKAGERLGLVDTKAMPDYLTQRQWKSVVNQVNAALRSWQETAVPLVRAAITALDVPNDEKHRLYRINLARRWWSDSVTARLVEYVAAHGHPFPNLSRVRTMLMDGPIAQVEESRTGTFRWWVRITLPGSKPIRVPLAGTPYMEAQPGKVKNFTQVHVADDEQVTLRLVKESPECKERTGGDVLGIDWGLTSLLTTSDGRRYGQKLYRWLVERDAELTTLQARLQQQNIRPRSSRRFRNLTSRIRSHVTNEVNRVLNRITEDRVRELVVEDLDFRGPGLSPRLRRIVSRAGRAALKRKLSSLRQDKGVVSAAVNPAHTSRECSGCGFADKTNRTSQARFKCRFCGKTLHADVNAARVISVRRSYSGAGVRASKHGVLAHLDERFEARWGIAAGRVRERQTRPCSRAASDHLQVGRGQLVV